MLRIFGAPHLYVEALWPVSAEHRTYGTVSLTGCLGRRPACLREPPSVASMAKAVARSEPTERRVGQPPGYSVCRQGFFAARSML